jgi:ribonuclease Z
MRPAFRPRLVNDPFSDPTLFIPFAFRKRALLFDLGDLHALSSKDILKVTHAFVTHTHMDHFIGFDTLLRIFLGRDKEIHLFGPPGFFKNVEGKLAGYTWNLVQNYESRFSIRATEVHPGRKFTRVYPCSDAFRGQVPTEDVSPSNTLVDEASFSVKAIHLDHKIPCLAFKLEERFHVNIIKERLDEMGIPVGPWLRRFKDKLYQSEDPEEPFSIEWRTADGKKQRTFSLGNLASQIARISKGQKIAYVVDVAFTPANAEKIVDFAGNADQLFIEAAFSEEEVSVAKEKHHLTAKQAGTLARKAQVKQFFLLHFSPRYSDDPDRLRREAEEAFSGGRSEPSQAGSLSENFHGSDFDRF